MSSPLPSSAPPPAPAATPPAATTAPAATAELQGRAEAALAGGSTHIARAYRPPIYVTRAVGAHKWLVDGRDLVDYTMGHGALLLGHAHPVVVEAVREQVARGTHFGASHPLEIEWAELIEALVPSAELVRFTSSGTEATLLALRIARSFTGREVVAKLHEHFHGWHDAVSVDLDAEGRPAPTVDGIPGAVSGLTRVVDPRDPPSLRRCLEDGRVAALILEASGAHYGRDPLPDGYVAEARALCDATGTLLVIDEVVTGFRVHPGGMQALLGLRPDLSTFGKIVAGGLPGGAVGGRREVMEQLALHDGRARVAHPGTFNANPLCAAAGIATLRLVADGCPQAAADATASQLEAIWRDRIAAAGVAGSVRRLASIVHTTFEDPALAASLPGALRDAGADFFRTSAFVSTEHDDADLELTQTAIDAALRARPRDGAGGGDG